MKQIKIGIVIMVLCMSCVIKAQTCSASFNYTANGNAFTFLPGSSAQGTGTSNYHTTWDFGDGTTAFYYNQPNLAHHYYSAPGTYIVTLSIAFLATDSSTACLATMSDTVTYNGCNIDAWITYSFQNSNTIDLWGYNANSQPPFDMGIWSIPETGFTDTSGGSTGFSNSTYVFPDSGHYHINFKIIDTIPGATCSDSTSIFIYVPYFSHCNANFSMWQDTLQPGTWYGWNYSNGTNLSYLWDFGDGTTDTSMYPSHTYAVLGHYNICLTAFSVIDSCSDSDCDTSSVHKFMANTGMDQFMVINPLGVKIIEKPIQMSLYPNPATESLTIQSEFTGSWNLVVTDVLGNEVLNKKFSGKKNLVDIAGLSPGIYFLNANDGESKICKRFIKE
jgi:hypothetical protein